MSLPMGMAKGAEITGRAFFPVTLQPKELPVLYRTSAVHSRMLRLPLPVSDESSAPGS